MTPLEREQLQHFLEQLVAARPASRDGEAEALIRDALTRQPDAAYLLVQRALIQGQALTSAQEEIARLRASQQSAGSFLGGNAWGNHAASVPPPVAPAAGPATSSGPLAGAGGWLGNIASTAAGVAAGAFLFQGIENLFGHHGNQGLLDSNHLASLPQESTVINNFFDDGGSSGNGLASLDDGLDDLTGDSDSWL